MFATHAASILDRDVFSEEYEAEWRAQLEMLPDEALMALDPKILCAGLMDRVARMRRAYADEMQRPQLPPRPEKQQRKSARLSEFTGMQVPAHPCICSAGPPKFQLKQGVGNWVGARSLIAI